MNTSRSVVLLVVLLSLPVQGYAQDLAENLSEVVQTASGPVQGAVEDDGLRIFRGIPFAQPPVGDLRWHAPQPRAAWTTVRPATKFAPRCMQGRVFGDIISRGEGMAEDCLYLNVWTPDLSEDANLPVLVYIYGGGFVAGDGSEPRYDGAAIAREGVVVVTMNYRLGVFGFLAHPELSAESEHGVSGNYGLLDQIAALEWVRDNIAAFGGDPAQVTIAGESAGSLSVSAHMVSVPSRGLFHRAIGESGSAMGTLTPPPLDDVEATGVRFAESLGTGSIEELRAKGADELLAATSGQAAFSFAMAVDGRVYPKAPVEIFKAGEQAKVPLLLGWNSLEMPYQMLLGFQEPTPETYAAKIAELYPDDSDEVLGAYPGETRDEVIASANNLASDRFIGLSTWRWFNFHRQTGESPVYRYLYAHPRPPAVEGGPGFSFGGPASGAVHAAEIEYALGNLDTNPIYQWEEDDYAVSTTMMEFFVNFIKTGDPNGPGVPEWPVASSEASSVSSVMVIDVESGAVPAEMDDRYHLLDRLAED